MPLPIIDLPVESDRLRLRRTEAGDADTYFALHTDADYIAYVGEPLTRERFDLQFAKELSEQPTGLSLAVVLRDSGAVIGEVMLLPATDHEVELVIAILPSHRREGYALEAAKAAIDAAFTDPHIATVMACVEDSHTASLRMVGELEMTLLGRTERLGGKRPRVFARERPVAGV